MFRRFGLWIVVRPRLLALGCLLIGGVLGFMVCWVWWVNPDEPALDAPTTETPMAEVANLEPTETMEPTDAPTATSTAEPTATAEPSATATTEPTDAPTATAEPTATSEPTATATVAPSATTEPTATATATTAPTATVTATATATAEPSQAPTIDSQPLRGYVNVGVGDEALVDGFVDPPDTSHQGVDGWQCTISPNGDDYDFRNLEPYHEARVQLDDLTPGVAVELEICAADGVAPDTWSLDFMCDGVRNPIGEKEADMDPNSIAVVEFTVPANLVCDGQAFVIFALPEGATMVQGGIYGVGHQQLIFE